MKNHLSDNDRNLLLGLKIGMQRHSYADIRDMEIGTLGADGTINSNDNGTQTDYHAPPRTAGGATIQAIPDPRIGSLGAQTNEPAQPVDINTPTINLPAGNGGVAQDGSSAQQPLHINMPTIDLPEDNGGVPSGDGGGGGLGGGAGAPVQGCPEDIKNCPDGTQVARDPELDCEFQPCPTKKKKSMKGLLFLIILLALIAFAMKTIKKKKM